MKTTASESVAQMVEVSITTFDKGDETIVFRSTGDVIKIKEPGGRARKIDLEVAVARMTELKLAGWGDTFEIKKMPTWAV